MNQSRVFWGLILILAGIIFALGNFGIINTKDVWGILGPSLMIIFGLWIVLRRWMRHQTINHAFEIPLGDASSGDLRIDFGAGRLNVATGTNPEIFIEGASSGEVNQKVQRVNQKIEAHLKMPSADLPIFSTIDNLNWSLLLNPKIPLRIEIQTGASENLVDLRKLQVTNLKVSSGASSTKILLPESNSSSMVYINAGAASIEVEIPTGVAARIHTQGALSSVSVDTSRFPKSQNFYQSPDYEESSNRIDVKAEIGVGSLVIR